jgi:NAD+ synthase
MSWKAEGAELEIQASPALELLCGFVRSEVGRAGMKRALLGLSGGIDSALAAGLAARALGGKNVLAVLMPYRSSAPSSLQDAHSTAKRFGLRTQVVPISPQVEPYFRRHPGLSRLRRGNKMARERMSILYDLSVAWQGLVLGTSNKTELLLGYGTQFGDMASALNPLGDLYKTQVRQLARVLGVPQEIIDKAPSADLWEGQTDEAELGFTYEKVDRLLYWMVDERATAEELHEKGFDPAFVGQVRRRLERTQFKRRPPLIAKLSGRTLDRDFRYPRDWGT